MESQWNNGPLGTGPIEVEKTYHVQLDITESRMIVSVNGDVRYDEPKDAHPLSESIPCYVGNPWFTPADAEISNLLITSGMF